MTALQKSLEALHLSSGCIFLIDHNKSLFRLSAQQGFPEEIQNKSYRIELHDKMLMASLLKKNTTVTPEPIFPPFKARLEYCSKKKPKELTCFLITAKNNPTGFIALDIPPDRDLIMGQDFRLLGPLGNFLGGAIEKTILDQEIQCHQEDLKELTAELFQSQENERRRIAAELHDEAGQALTGIKFTLEAIENYLPPEGMQIRKLFNDVKNQINSTYEEMRRLSYRLHPALLSDLGLEPALESYLGGVSEKRGVHIDFKMLGFESRVDSEIENVLYRISQEALNNTLKHAKATTFKLSIVKGYPNIVFCAEDNGIGFDLEKLKVAKKALGLLAMKERVALLGGEFAIRSSKGNGTRIRIEIPFRRKENAGKRDYNSVGR